MALDRVVEGEAGDEAVAKIITDEGSVEEAVAMLHHPNRNPIFH